MIPSIINKYNDSKTYDEGYIYDVYDPDGIFICNITLDNYGKREPDQIDTPLHAKSRNGFIYVMRTEETGYRELVVYKMIWQ